MYSPFEREISELEAADLSTLRNVQEGWYVEYKREIPSVRSIAKSISAFANTYGGWLFYGIAEANSGDRKAGDFPGIDNVGSSSAEVAIREAAAAHLSPAPFFQIRTLSGPSEGTGLHSGRSIVVVHIPQSTDAPHVHSDGRIFRRVGDASDPVAETDRHFLDLLWRRGEDRRRLLREKCRSILPRHMRGKNRPQIELVFIPHHWPEELAKKESHLAISPS